MAGCIILSMNNACGPEFAGYPIAGTYNNEATFNEFVRGYNSTEITANRLSSSNNNCSPSLDLRNSIEQLRYQTSYFCARIVFQSVYLHQCSVQPTGNMFGPLICKDQCNLAVASLSNLVLNSTLCKPTNATLLSETLSQSVNACNMMDKAVLENNGCLPGISAESNICGFKNINEFSNYCAAFQNDPCCQSTSDVQTAMENSLNSPSTGTIIGVIVGIILVAFALGVFLYLKFFKKSQIDKNVDPVVSEQFDLRPVLPDIKILNGDESSTASRDIALPRIISTQRIPSPQLYNPDTRDSASVWSESTTSKSRENLLSQNESNMNTIKRSDSESPLLLEQDFSRNIMSTISVDTTTSTLSMSSVSHSSTPALPPPAFQPQFHNLPMKKVVVVHKYESSMPDELTLIPGSSVILIRIYDDGWALGADPITGMKGAFPMVCVENARDSIVSLSVIRKRDSSIYAVTKE